MAQAWWTQQRAALLRAGPAPLFAALAPRGDAARAVVNLSGALGFLTRRLPSLPLRKMSSCSGEIRWLATTVPMTGLAVLLDMALPVTIVVLRRSPGALLCPITLGRELLLLGWKPRRWHGRWRWACRYPRPCSRRPTPGVEWSRYRRTLSGGCRADPVGLTYRVVGRTGASTGTPRRVRSPGGGPKSHSLGTSSRAECAASVPCPPAPQWSPAHGIRRARARHASTPAA